MNSTSVEKRICEGVADKLLDAKVSDYHIAEIASEIKEWEVLALNFSLTESEREEIKEDFQGRYNLQKRQALRVWRWKNGDKATYRNLISICCSQGLISLAETIAQYPGSKQRPRSSELLDGTFYQYLLDCYREQPHPSSQQWPSRVLSYHGYIPTKFFDLILHKAPLHEVSNKKPSIKLVSLSDVLTKGRHDERLLVYFEGIAGSGKTVLSWYVCKEWANKRLLQEFQLLIYIQISALQVQSHTCLADILPYPDKNFCQLIAAAIGDQKGKGVCLLLDGLDEAPAPLLRNLLADLIQGSLGWPKFPFLSIMMTSRPDSRVTKQLERILSSRIIIKGFNNKQLCHFLDESLGYNSIERTMIAEKFKVNPTLEALCSHPVNAVVITSLIHIMKGEIPTTQTDLYNLLICNLLMRHIENRLPGTTQHYIPNINEYLPPEICKDFKRICSLAYSSLINNNKQLFSMEELGKAYIHDMLGLLEVHPRITMYGSERYYSFAHPSLQEFLAAVHLSKMKESDQVVAVKHFLENNPLSQVLPFYAGLTSLSNIEALKEISKALSQSEGNMDMPEHMKSGDDLQRKVLTFINCMFECHNESLLRLPITDMTADEYLQKNLKEELFLRLLSIISLNSLTLTNLPLLPLDCLSLGYYICTKTRVVSDNQLLLFSLIYCSIDNIGIRVFFTELKKNIAQRTAARVILHLTGNKFDKETLLSLKNLVQGQSNIEGIALHNCFDPKIVDNCFALKCITEGLSNNSSCGFIDLSDNFIIFSHIHYIILMLRVCRQIYYLDLSFFNLSRVMPLLSAAIALKVSLKSLVLTHCNISDSDLVLLGERIPWCLCQLNIYNNPITSRGVSDFLGLFVDNLRSRLVLFLLGLQLSEEQKQTVEKINQFRDKNQMSDPREHLLVMTTSSSLPSTNVGNQGYCYVSAASTWDLQGVEICGETSVVLYSSRAQQFEWEGFGLKLYIHEGSLPVGMEQCILQIKASLAGLYEFPEDSHLISAVFWFRCKTVHKFIKPITVEIQHCAKAKNISELNFVRAFCSQKQLPYTFKQIAGGNFKSRKSCGVIDLNSFSGIAAIQNKSEERDYCSIVFYHGERRVDMYRGEKMVNIFYVIVWNTEAHLNFVYECYKEMGALPVLDQAVEFEEDRIELDIPMDGVTVKGGWQITPLIPPVIMKKNVDSYEPKKRIPNCQLAAKAMERGVPDLIYHVKLIGARYPQTEFVIYLSPSINAEYPQAVGTVGSATSISAFKADHQHKTRSSELESASEDRSSLISVSKYASEAAENITSSTSHSDLSSTIIVSELVTRLNPGAVSLSHLNLIKWKDASGEIRRLHLIEEMSHKWCSIGGIIGMSHSVLENIAEKNRGNPEECCRAVLGRWLDNPPPDYPTTWQGLLELLEDSQLCKVASDLKKLLNNVMV